MAHEPGKGSGNAQLLLHFFEGNAFGFRIKKKDDEKLQDHHCGKEDERIAPGFLS
jgi:hypothetical protein